MAERRYYGFAYFDGSGTNTTRFRGQRYMFQWREAVVRAGTLWSFKSRDLRDAWVSAGYSCPVPRDVGEFRAAMTTRDLELGWRTSDAQDWVDDE